VRIGGWLFLGFLVVPIVEVALFVVVGGRIGVGWTLAVVVATAVFGSWMVTRQGRETWLRFREELASGVYPGRSLAHGALIVVAGTLLLTPGFLTDAVGLLLLLPPVREAVRRWILRRSRSRWEIVP